MYPAKENVLPRQEMDNKKRGSSGSPNRGQLHTTLSPNTINQTHKLRVYYANVDNSLLSKYDEIIIIIIIIYNICIAPYNTIL